MFEDLNAVIKQNVNFGSQSDEGKIGTYCSEDDYSILEDASGRITIKENEQFDSRKMVTGSIMALKGKADEFGYFCVDDYCYAGIPFKVEFPK